MDSFAYHYNPTWLQFDQCWWHYVIPISCEDNDSFFLDPSLDPDEGKRRLLLLNEDLDESRIFRIMSLFCKYFDTSYCFYWDLFVLYSSETGSRARFWQPLLLHQLSFTRLYRYCMPTILWPWVGAEEDEELEDVEDDDGEDSRRCRRIAP